MARTLEIDSTEVYYSPDWSVNKQINQIATASFTVVDKLTLTEINIGDSIELFDGATKVFSGIIKEVAEVEDMPNVLYYNISASDNNALADKRLIASSTVGDTAETIIRDEILPILAEEGVTEGTITCATVIKKATFNRIKASECLNQLKDLTGFTWFINNDKELNFIDPSTNVASFTLSDSIQHSGFNRTRNLDTYRNIQYVRGGRGRTNTQSNEAPTPEPDGISRKFIVRFPIAEKPTITINSVDVSAGDIGINGLDTGKEWYFGFNSNIITQDTSETVLTSSDTIEITYTGLYDLLSISEDLAEIATRQTAETGTSGKYEILNEEKSIDDADQALQFSEGLIEKYAKITNKISFNTEYASVEPGELLPVVKTLYGINESFLIENVTIFAIDSATIGYSVSGLSGESVGGWEDFFKQIINTGKKYVIGANEVLILLNKQSETETLAGEIDISTFDLIVCSETTICSDSLIMSPLASEVTVND